MDLKASLRQLGIASGDAVIVHSSFESFEGFRGSVTDAIQVLRDVIGPDGALLMPTIPFSGSAVEYARTRPLLDVNRTPSSMGIITEIFRRLPGVTRSVHPTHPVAGWGAKAAPLLATHRLAHTPCGAGSPFARLVQTDGKILLLGVSINAMTFFHYLEEDLEGRMPFSPFTTETFTLDVRDEEGQTVSVATRLYDPIVGRERDGELLTPHLKAGGVWREAKVGRLKAIVLRCGDVKKIATEMASKGLFCYHNVPRLSDQRPSATTGCHAH
jgi:aminoglycoside N3'-acetyltransferase